jgi:hypothetical protein
LVLLDNESYLVSKWAPRKRSRRDNSSLWVSSASPCQLEADSEEENTSPSATSKRFFLGSCLSGVSWGRLVFGKVWDS